MRTILAGACLAAVALLWGARPARAQEIAHVNAIVRVVKSAPSGSTSFADAKIGTRLDAGGRLRTGGRSKAGVAFENKSTLSLDELTEVIVAGATQTDVRVLGGRILGNFTRPGTVSGGHATAAVRGTKFIYFESPKDDAAYVRCYSDSVYVGPPGVQMRAGGAELTSPTTLVDPNLVGDEEDWVGKSVVFMRPGEKGETRKVTAFDKETGTLTLDEAIPDGAVAKLRQDARGGEIEYLLTSDPEAEVVRLTPGEGITVRGGHMGRSYRIADLNFAEGERDPWFREIHPGLSTRTFPGTDSWRSIMQDLFPVQDAAQDLMGDMNPGDLNQVLAGSGDLIIIIPPDGKGVTSFGVHSAAVRSQLFGGAGAGLGSAAGAAGGAASAAGLGLQSLTELQREEQFTGTVPPAYVANPGNGVWFRAEPFGVLASSGDSEGFRLRAFGATKSLFAEAGTRIMNLNENFVAQMSEANGVYRARSFDIIAGRWHPYLGPSTNTNLGALLGFNTFDAGVIKTNLKGPYQQLAGYIWNSSPLQGTPYRGFFARGQYSVLEGQLGWQLLNITETLLPANTLIPFVQTGWQVDGSFPVVRNQLDVYSQLGIDTFDNFIGMGGLYFPGVYQKIGLDVFAEYHHQDTIPDQAELWLRKPVGKRLYLMGFVQKNMDGGAWDGGGALQYSALIR